MLGYSAIYIKINEQNNDVYSSGITFADFAKAIDNPRCYLILAGFPDECKFSRKLFLHYVTGEQVQKLINQDVYSFGDFCWVDFENEEQLDAVTDYELARILYMSHMKKALDSFIIDNLSNEYAYLCHDDGSWNHTYLRDLSKYKKVIKCRIENETEKYGKRFNLSENLIDEIYNMCKEGLIIDFIDVEAGIINFYFPKNINTIDDLENALINMRKDKCSQNIQYSLKNMVWGRPEPYM
ncbi:MAG: hypothetical protein GX236_08195 [Clostridiaceae bacterium]|nr:hypothetical protein [Clostridiaceae bacterium]